MKAQMYNIRRTHKNLSFRCSFSFIRLCLVGSLSVDGSFLSQYAGQRTGFKLPTLCLIESTNKTIFLEVHRANHRFSLWLWKEILTLDSNKPDPQISRSVGWTHMQSQSCRFVSAVAAALNNTTTSYYIELKDLRTLLKHKLA